MEGVTALQNSDLSRRVKEPLQTYGAVSLHGFLDAAVGALDRYRVAAVASRAMEIILPPANAANTTQVAMERLLLESVIVPEIADVTEILTQTLSARSAILRALLSRFTPAAYHFHNLRPLHLMRLTTVVAKSAGKFLSTARSNDCAPMSILFFLTLD